MKALEMIFRHLPLFGLSRSDAEPIDELLDEDKVILEDFNERSIGRTKPPTGPKGRGGTK